MRHRPGLFVAVIFLPVVITGGCGRRTEPAGPLELVPGPYPHQSVRISVFGKEHSGKRFWLFEPAAPRPARAPVVVFNHGWMNKTPRKHRAWIEHLVRRGNIVIYPRFQDGLFGNPKQYLPNSVAAIKQALLILQTQPFRVRPDRRRVALIGYSIGGLLNMSQAAVAQREGLPRPRAIFNVAPGNTWLFPMEDLADVPADVCMVSLFGDADLFVGSTDAVKFTRKTPQIPPGRKWLVELHSDYHAFPPLIADHDAALGVRQRSGDPLGRTFPVNAHDWALWRLGDALLEAAFGNKPLDLQPLLDLGRWPDGKPVRPMTLVAWQ